MKPIEPDRAEALPETLLCKEHAEKIKKYGDEFIRTTSQERTSKPGSLKRNYGGVNTRTKRNYRALERLKDEYEDEKWRQREADRPDETGQENG
jgi:hypothetical protein